MRVPTALLLLPLAALAQTPPPEVDQALRARVNEFFQYHVDGNFRKAYELVAEDTKDYYFATQKVQFKSFTVDSVKFNDDFSNAEVDLTGKRIWKPRADFPETLITVPMKTMWKIENGKWVWYDHESQNNKWITAMGPSDTAALQKKGADPSSPPDMSPAAIQARAAAILAQPQQPPLDKTELVLPLDKPSSQQIVFHNSQEGAVKVYVDASAKPAGFTAELDGSDVNGGKDAVIKIRFDPTAAPPSPANFTLRVIMEPFDRIFPVSIKFAPRTQEP